MINEKNTSKISSVILYAITIILCLRFSILNNNIYFHKLLPIIAGISFLLLIFNYKEILNLCWLKENKMIILYLIVRLMSLLCNTEKWLNLKGFLYEIFFIIVIQFGFKKDKEKFNTLSLIIIAITFIQNIISVIYQYLIQMDYSRELFGIYNNPNGMAILNMISIVLFFNIKENKYLLWYDYLYLIFSTSIIILAQCRTIYIVLVTYTVLKLILNKKEKLINIFSIALKLAILACLSIIIIISYYNRQNIIPSKFEYNINEITTNRYFLWKYSIFSMEENPILGIGENNIGIKRYLKINQSTIGDIESPSRISKLKQNDTHNGYIQLLVSNGILCFVLFVCFIFKRINTYNVNLFLLQLVILIINIFENEFILTQSITIFLLMYVINIEIKNGDANHEKNSNNYRCETSIHKSSNGIKSTR